MYKDFIKNKGIKKKILNLKSQMFFLRIIPGLNCTKSFYCIYNSSIDEVGRTITSAYKGFELLIGLLFNNTHNTGCPRIPHNWSE